MLSMWPSGLSVGDDGLDMKLRRFLTPEEYRGLSIYIWSVSALAAVTGGLFGGILINFYYMLAR